MIQHLCLLGLFLIGLISHLGGQSLSANPPLKTVLLKVGSVSVSAEVAQAPQELAQGLMFRTRLSDNSGMIFCLLAEERASFWMKNVSLPLSVAYLDRKGVILEILEMKPFDETPLWSQSDKVFYALEMNQGWFKLNQVKVGDRVVVEGKSLESLRAN